jgi:hypothetical protein
MDLPKRLNKYAMTEGRWITFLALAYAGGGVLGALQRALTLIGGNERVRALVLRCLALVSRRRERADAIGSSGRSGASALFRSCFDDRVDHTHTKLGRNVVRI